jgi:hypothetical protein
MWSGRGLGPARTKKSHGGILWTGLYREKFVTKELREKRKSKAVVEEGPGSGRGTIRDQEAGRRG